MNAQATVEWGEWFGSYKTAAAAKRYVTMNWVGPKVNDSFNASEVRQRPDGQWEVRVGEVTA
jgi:hypothetical protein